MESKDVQQLFKDVLGSAERGEQPLNCVEGSGAGQDPGRAQRPFLQGELQLPGQGGCTQGLPPPPFALSERILCVLRSWVFLVLLGMNWKGFTNADGWGFLLQKGFWGVRGGDFGSWKAFLGRVVGILYCVKVPGAGAAL